MVNALVFFASINVIGKTQVCMCNLMCVMCMCKLAGVCVHVRDFSNKVFLALIPVLKY